MKRKLFIALVIIFIFTARQAASVEDVPQPLDLKQGFNFVAFTTNPMFSPAQMKAQFASIDDIYSYSTAAGSFLSVSEGSLTAFAAGKGYIIKTKENSTLTVGGSAISPPGDIALKAGFNLIGISKTVEPLAFSALMAGNNSFRGMYKYNTAAGSFVQVVRNASDAVELIDGIDPVFAAGQSYFINMKGESKLNYDSGRITAVFPSPSYSLLSISLSKSSDTVTAASQYDLGVIKTTAFYDDSTSKTVTPAWIIKAGGGVLGGTTYTTPAVAGTVVLSASYSESGVTKTVELTLNVNLPAGLAGYWNFDEGSGTVAVDLSGKGNNGSIVGGAAFVEGVSGKALLFNGSGYVNIPSSPSIDMVNNMSVSLWAKIDPASVPMATLIAKGHTHVGGIRGWAMRVNSDTMPGETEFFGGVNGVWQTVVFPNLNPPDNAWHLVTGVKDGSGMRVFVDGVLRNSNTAAGGDFNSVSEFDLRIGDDVINQGRAIIGAIDDVRIYNYALSTTEVQNYYMMIRLAAFSD